MSAPLLRRADQLTIAVLTALWLVGLVAWWVGSGGLTGALVEIDNAPPLSYEFLVDLNQADWPELAQLPGIGETLGRRIVESRELEGAFRSVDDLERVNGIGPRKMQEMRRYLLPMIDDTQVAGEQWDADQHGSDG